MAKSKKHSTLSVELPSQQHLNYITEALSIVNHYRLLQNKPIHNLETYCIHAVLEGAKAVHDFYQQQQKEAQRNAQEAANSVDTASDASARESGATAAGASSDAESSDSVSVGAEQES